MDTLNLDLKAFRDFCVAKGDEAYEFHRHTSCALAQFLATQYRSVSVGVYDVKIGLSRLCVRKFAMPDGVNQAVYVSQYAYSERTFAKLASRLDELILAQAEAA